MLLATLMSPGSVLAPHAFFIPSREKIYPLPISNRFILTDCVSLKKRFPPEIRPSQGSHYLLLAGSAGRKKDTFASLDLLLLGGHLAFKLKSGFAGPSPLSISDTLRKEYVWARRL